MDENIGNDELAGRCLVVGVAGPVLDGVTAKTFLDLCPAGIILFSRNLREPSQILDLMEALRNTCAPALHCIDQEGGLVDRLRAVFPRFPPVELLADSGNDDVLYQYGKWTGDILSAFGFNVNFAPVVDLKFHDEKNALQKRYLGKNPETVGRLARRYLQGLQSVPVTGCCKHFPGLGRARLDSHYELPEIQASLRELLSQDILPYRLVREELRTVMINHAAYPQLQQKVAQPGSGSAAAAAAAAPTPPASCSPAVYKLLREELGFRGIAVTDDLDMQAVHQVISSEQIPLRAFDAGADLLLIGENLDFARTCRDRLAESFEDPNRRHEALNRTTKLKSIPPAPRVDVLRVRELATGFEEWKKSLGLGD
jgi:beta-N-acetylhexosaminidase